MSDEVSQFLEQVEKLRGQQIEEDEVRARELEEYLAAKRERQSRREERARSISPQKSSPANTPSPTSTLRGSASITARTKLDSPGPRGFGSRETSLDPDVSADSTMALSIADSSAKENESPLDANSKRAGSTTPTGRSQALSWQKRPSSRAGPGARPLSVVAAQNATQRSLAGSQEPPSNTSEETLSKEQIAQALGSKDPSWFRQTADRGVGLAAYRKNQVEDTDRSDVTSASPLLPGMSRRLASNQGSNDERGHEQEQEQEKEKEHEDEQEQDTPRATTPHGLASPLPLNPPKTFDTDKDTNGRTSPTRSTSPTKGMGGFVQSAMMKRSDSVKRWSVTSPPGLARVDSVTSSRPSATPRPLSIYRGGAGVRAPAGARAESGQKAADKADVSSTSIDTMESPPPNEEDASLPSSPTKTMDPRRWSPTKSSWLESALNKPESPKPEPKPYQANQPAWMVELNKNKAERASNPNAGHSRPASVSHKHQVSIGGLKRPAPPGAVPKPDSLGLGGIYSPPVRGSKPSPTHGATPSFSTPSTESSTQAEEIEAEAGDKPEDPEPKKDEPSPKEAEVEVMAPVTETKPQPKSKPETPPKKDFRSTLRSRAPEPAGAKKEQPEFKNALGALRRTQTQNYVAPDELKSNILRGKAGLNTTGGPQKSEIKDEFKEAILKKKDDFKTVQSEGRGVSRSTTSAAEKPIPEGLARRAELGRQRTVARNQDVSGKSSTPKPTSQSPKPVPGPKRVASGTQPSPGASSPSPKPTLSTSPPGEAIRRVSTEPSSASVPPSEVRELPVLKKETSVPSSFPARSGGGKLANRFNPALAGILARGPPPAAAGGRQDSGDSSPVRASSAAGDITEPTSTGPQLSHMTKGRARGPRRKAPTTAAPAVTTTTPSGAAASTVSSSSSATATAPKPARLVERQMSPKPTISPHVSSPTPSPLVRGVVTKPATEFPVQNNQIGGLPIRQQGLDKAPLRGRLNKEENSESLSLGNAPPSRIVAASQGLSSGKAEVSAARELPSPPKPANPASDLPEPGSPKKLNMNRMSRFLDQSSTSTGSTEAVVREPIKLTHQRTGSRSPVKSFGRPLPDPVSTPVRKDEVKPVPVAVAIGQTAAPVLKSNAAKSPPIGPKPSFTGSSPRPETPKTPSRSSRPLPLAVDEAATRSPVTRSPARSPTKQHSEISIILHDFFGPQPPYEQVEIDPTELLTKRRDQAGGKINSKSVRMFQFSSEGKKAPVAEHNERVLFAGEMYVCSHEFINEAGWKRSELYFWIGDEVPEASAADASLFAAKEAKFLGGKLVEMKQGKETPEFLQALGGMVIIRRGSNTKYDSLAPSMLCGRRFQGQVAFDEVDFSAGALCAGFPYLVSRGGGCSLWKGKGSDADEISAARLVGMEMALMGEMAEYEDGKETDSFWRLFDLGGQEAGEEKKKKPHSADHWRLKPHYSKYSGRLFCSDSESKQQIFEISPFSQADLLPAGIYILDAFFEMYVVVGRSAQSQYKSFRNALTFAQEYAVLASTVEDRPFIPIATVVLEGIPRDLKSVFRKWDDERSPTVTNAPGGGGPGLKRGRSLRVVPLTQALQALKE